MKKSHTLQVLSLLVATGMAQIADAHWGPPQEMPLDRVIANLETWVKDHPKDPGALFSLARAHSYAFATNELKIETHDVGGRPDLQSNAKGWRPVLQPGKVLKADVKHLDAGIRSYNAAIKLRPTEPKYRYGLACLLEDGLSVRRSAIAFPMLDVDVVRKEYTDQMTSEKTRREAISPPDNDSFALWGRNIDRVRAAEWVIARERLTASADAKPALDDMSADAWVLEMNEQYFSAMCLALPEDSTAREQRMLGVSSFLAYQAATDYLRVSHDVQPAENFPVRKEVAAATVREFSKLPPCGAITPLVIPLANAASISEVLDDTTTVNFDLDGTQRPQSYHWIKPQAGFLVWDPQNTGTITSGRQLFGSATWWLFFQDGFAALASLDNDHDGTLRGDELTGLSVWVDANSNGICDPGEVTPLAKLGITALSCRATGNDGSSLISAAGVEFADGSSRPLWDWITTPLSPTLATTPELTQTK